MQDDVLKNSFNVLRMFVKIYGASRAPTMLVSRPSSSARHTPLPHVASTHLSINHFQYLFPCNFEITVYWVISLPSTLIFIYSALPWKHTRLSLGDQHTWLLLFLEY